MKISYFLENQRRLLQGSIILSLIPASLSLIPELVWPVFIGLVFLLFYFKLDLIKSFLNNFRSTPLIFKLSYGFALTGLTFSIYIIHKFLIPKPNLIVNILLSVILFLIVQNSIISKIEEFPSSPILIGQTTYNDYRLGWFTLSGSLSSTTVFSGIIIIIDSLTLSRGSTIFMEEALKWLIMPGLALAIGLLRIRFAAEYDLPEDGGITRYHRKQLPDLPERSLNPNILSKYLKAASTHPEPPEEFLDYLDSNLEGLVKNVRQITYIEVVQELIMAFSYWGEKGKQAISHLNLIVMASLTRFTTIGLIPLYLRYHFYTYLELLYKLDLVENLEEDWLDLLEFEFEEGNDEHHRLAWIFDQNWDDSFHDDSPWYSLWNGKIYWGEKGYNNLSTSLKNQSTQSITLNDWTRDVWKLTYSHLQHFIGPEGRTAMDGEYSLDRAIEFLARKQSLEEFEKSKEQDPSPTQSYDHSPSLKSETISEEKINTRKQKMENYLQGGSLNESNTGFDIKAEFQEIKIRIINLFTLKNIRHFLILGGALLFAIINVYAILYLQTIFSKTLIESAFAIEIVILQLLGVPGGKQEIIEETDFQKKSQDENSNYTTNKLDSGFVFSSYIILVYSFFLIFLYYYLQNHIFW